MSHHENPEIEWVYDGRDCRAVVTDLGNWCGYAKTPLRFDYDDVYGFMNTHTHQIIDVHGGLTYGVDSEGWVGFDCAHAGDVSIVNGDVATKYPVVTAGGPNRTEWTEGKVKKEVERLADQLTLLENFVKTVTGTDRSADTDWDDVRRVMDDLEADGYEVVSFGGSSSEAVPKKDYHIVVERRTDQENDTDNE